METVHQETGTHLLVADEVWIALAMLHRNHPQRASFSAREILDQVKAEQAHPRFARASRHTFICTTSPTWSRIRPGTGCCTSSRMTRTGSTGRAIPPILCEKERSRRIAQSCLKNITICWIGTSRVLQRQEGAAGTQPIQDIDPAVCGIWARRSEGMNAEDWEFADRGKPVSRHSEDHGDST